jgi:hypothetical protein
VKKTVLRTGAIVLVMETNKYKITSGLKTKINVMKLFFTALIVFYHANSEVFFNGRIVSNECDKTVCSIFDSSGELGNVFFAFMAGFLLFYNIDVSCIRRKFVSRCRSLMIPYILWNLLGFVVIGIPQHHLMKDIVLNFLSSSYDGPLWFVGFLIVMSLLMVPNWMILRNKITGIVFIIFVYIMNYEKWYGIFAQVPTEIHILRSFTFIPIYLIGGYVGIHFPSIIDGKYKKSNLLKIIAVFCFLISYIPILRGMPATIMTELRPFEIWILISESVCVNIYRPWMDSAFLIYCSHAFVLGGLYRVLHLVFDADRYVSVSYGEWWRFGWGSLTIVICVFLSQFMNKKTSKMYRVLIGGR